MLCYSVDGYDHVADQSKVSDILDMVLGVQYDRQLMWASRKGRPLGRAPFTFADSQGRFTALLMRLDGITGRTQGHGNLIYHLDVKASDKPQSRDFKLTQEELDRVSYSPHCFA